jgi:hypothetical protein
MDEKTIRQMRQLERSMLKLKRSLKDSRHLEQHKESLEFKSNTQKRRTKEHRERLRHMKDTDNQ